jgi:hypothetical protein
MKANYLNTKKYFVVRSDKGNMLVRHSSMMEPSDETIAGPFEYLEACHIRDTHQNKPSWSLPDLIKALDKFTEPEIIKALRGDNNVGIRRKAKGLATKLASAAIKTGMEAMQVQPVKK